MYAVSNGLTLFISSGDLNYELTASRSENASAWNARTYAQTDGQGENIVPSAAHRVCDGDIKYGSFR